MIVSRRSRVSQQKDAYLPCPECRVLYSAKQLWKHCQTCNAKSGLCLPKFEVRRSVVRKAKVLMKMGIDSKGSDIDFVKDVLGTLRHDKVASVVKKDDIICMFG